MSIISISPCDKYVTDFTITSPESSDTIAFFAAIPIAGNIVNPIRVTLIECEYQGTWNSAGVAFNVGAGTFTHNTFTVVPTDFSVHTIQVRVTWANGDVITKSQDFFTP